MNASPPPPDRPWLRDYLAERDEACPSCGYNLRGLTSDVCPECRQRLVLAVRPAEPRLAWFITALTAFGGLIGFNGLILGWFLWHKLYRSNFGGPDWSDALPLGTSLLVGGLGISLLARLRRRFFRASRTTRAAIGLAAWAATLLSAVWFFASV